MYYSSFAHLKNDYPLPDSAGVAPVERRQSRSARVPAHLPLWRSPQSRLAFRIRAH
jgi:hypothetical protein